MILPRLYAILDAACFATAPDPTVAIGAYARQLTEAGVALLQYRNKNGNSREMLAHGRELRRVIAAMGEGSRPCTVSLIMNDRADLCLAADFDGVHVGQDDLSPAAARAIVGPGRSVGVSTHNPDQVREADQLPVDYIAVGPVFTTASKAKPDPVIGLDGVRRARSLTRKPLVGIGGITRANCHMVIGAGADSVAVIADLVQEPRTAAEEFLRILG